MQPKERSNLRAWCQKCHNSYDATSRRAGINERAARDQGNLF
jgi:5-methylcytosine-specific restriction endonuclease McrA